MFKFSLGSLGAYAILTTLYLRNGWSYCEEDHKIRAYGGKSVMHTCKFDCQLGKLNLGSFGAFPNFSDLVSRKQLIIERNEPQFGPLWQVFSAYRVL